MSTTLHDWLKKLAPLFHPIRSETKTNRDFFARVFPRFASATCNSFKFCLVHFIVRALRDCIGWSDLILCLWFHDTHLKTAQCHLTRIVLQHEYLNLRIRGRDSSTALIFFRRFSTPFRQATRFLSPFFLSSPQTNKFGTQIFCSIL